MTNEEAIQILNCIEEVRGDLPEDGLKIDEALIRAKEALKKQIPNKAVGEYYARMRCPSCNHRIPSGLGSSSRRRDNWCNYCGQRIDWSDEG